MARITIKSRLKANPEFISEMKNPNITLYTIAAKYNVSYTSIFNIANEENLMCGRIPGGVTRTVKPDVVDKIKELSLEGKTITEMAKELNLGKATISSYKKLHGLTKIYKRKDSYERAYNNRDVKLAPCRRISLIRASNVATQRGIPLEDFISQAINFYIENNAQA